MAATILSSSWPAGPTNGWPERSSSWPGPSPTNTSFDSGSPRANTVCVRPLCSSQRVQPRTSCSSWASRRRTSPPATTGSGERQRSQTRARRGRFARGHRGPGRARRSHRNRLLRPLRVGMRGGLGGGAHVRSRRGRSRRGRGPLHPGQRPAPQLLLPLEVAGHLRQQGLAFRPWVARAHWRTPLPAVGPLGNARQAGPG